MKLVVQPPGSKRLCGQCVVAMVGGISLKKAVELIGHEKETGPKEIAMALRKLGVRVPRNRLVRFSKKRPLPRRCVLKVVLLEGHDTWSHWILRWDGRDYDPGGRARAYWLNRNPRVTSHLEISPRRWSR